MKNISTIILLSLFLGLNSQEATDKKQLFEKQLVYATDDYLGNAGGEIVVQNKLLNERLLKAFNQVIFGGSDLVDNASAFGYSQNKEKTNISVNTNFHIHDGAKHQFFVKVGLNANGSGSIFDFYSNEEWKNSVGGNIGLIWKFRGSGYSNEEKSRLEYNKVLRKIFIKDSINRLFVLKKDSLTLYDITKGHYKQTRDKYLNAIKEENKDDITSFYKHLKSLEAFFTKLRPYLKSLEKRKLDFNSYTDKETNDNNDKITDAIIDLYWKETNEKDTAIRKIINDIAYEYDNKHIKNTGYTLWWLDANLNMNNNTYNFSEKVENINSTILSNFNALTAQKTGINKLNTVISTNLNYSKNTQRGVLFLKGGFAFNSGSFLGSNLINGTAKINRIDTNNLFIIEDEDNLVLGDFNSIDRDLQFGSVNIYGAYFFGKKKTFGLNLALTHRYSIKTPDNSFYKNNYSVLLGPIFRKPQKDDDTGLTFGIDIGYDNSLYSSRAKEDFVARIRLGIPFKLYDISK